MKRDWFDGIRLGTREQERLIEAMRKDPKLTVYATGDTFVIRDSGEILILRQDYSVADSPAGRRAQAKRGDGA